MDPRPLPPGFISQYDPNTQRCFYVDTNTGVSQWNHPLDVKPPSAEQNYSVEFPSSNPNPNPQGHHPLGFTDPSSFPSSEQRPPPSALPQPSNYPPTTYGKGMPESSYQQPSSSSYPQPTQNYPPSNYPPSNYPPSNYPPSNYPPSNYPPSNYPPSNYPPSNYPPSNYPPSNYPPSNYPPSYPQSGPEYYEGEKSKSGHSKKPEKGLFDSKLLAAGVGAVGGLMTGKMVKHKFKHKKHKGWKGWKGKGWKGKGWKGKGWKGKGWKGWK